MATRKSVPSSSHNDNGQPLGDAAEPAGRVDATFDPAELERPADPAQAGAAQASPDPFDPAALRLGADFTAAAGVKKALLRVPVRKPDRAWFVRVHPSDSYALQTALIEAKEDRETYLVDRPLWPGLAGEPTFGPRALFTAVNRQGVIFLWPVRLPGPDGRLDDWSRTALEAAQMARRGWVRVVANMGLGGYDVWEATAPLPDPEWPDTPFKELLRIAFRDRRIDSEDHPKLRQLRGEV